jgi:peptidoglycan hydrolase CwlO-like protein
MRAGKDLENKLDNINEKLAEIKSDYNTKENDFKTNKTKIKEVQASIDALKTEFGDAQETLKEISVREFYKERRIIHI